MTPTPKIFDYEIEAIMEHLLDEGLPVGLCGEVEELIVNEHARGDRYKELYRKVDNELSWTVSPDRPFS